MIARYGSENNMSQRKVQEWAERLKTGRKCVTDDTGSACHNISGRKGGGNAAAAT